MESDPKMRFGSVSVGGQVRALFRLKQCSAFADCLGEGRVMGGQQDRRWSSN